MSGYDTPLAPWHRRRPGGSEAIIPLRISGPDDIPAGFALQVRPLPRRGRPPANWEALRIFVAYGPGEAYANVAAADAGLRWFWASSSLPAPDVTANAAPPSRLVAPVGAAPDGAATGLCVAAPVAVACV
jgi:hypothetical protein